MTINHTLPLILHYSDPLWRWSMHDADFQPAVDIQYKFPVKHYRTVDNNQEKCLFMIVKCGYIYK